jgi:hypothetical protein
MAQLRAPFLIAAIALAWLDYSFRVLLPVLRQRTPDVRFFIKLTLIVAPHEAFVPARVD